MRPWVAVAVVVVHMRQVHIAWASAPSKLQHHHAGGTDGLPAAAAAAAAALQRHENWILLHGSRSQLTAPRKLACRATMPGAPMASLQQRQLQQQYSTVKLDLFAWHKVTADWPKQFPPCQGHQ
eukprot:1154178-Pelagomonas_calceolata.AAC.1